MSPQVHADASRFEAGVSKQEVYEKLLQEAAALVEGQRNWVQGCPISDTALSETDDQ